MNGSSDPARPVRPGFVKGAFVSAALLLPVVVHAAWGYVETRRLSAAIQTIEAKGEPVRTPSVAPVGEAATAARYYRAAAALASDFRTDPSSWSGELINAERTGNWSGDLLAKIRAVVAPHEEMLSLADRAAELPFDDFGPGTTYGYLAAGINNVIRISSLRAVVNALDGDAGGAAYSLYAALQAGRSFNRNGPLFAPYSLWFSSAVDITMERVRPGEVELERLATALEAVDDDNVLRRELQGARAAILDRGLANQWFIVNRVAPASVVDRPWRTHLVNRQLAWYADVLNAIDVPWPDRIDAVGRVDYFNLDAQRTREDMLQSVEFMVVRLAVVRSLRTAVAIERYRRGHSEQLPDNLSDLSPLYLPAAPIDPFTGQPLLYTRIPDGYGYIVYSTGMNRRNDNGDVSAQWAGGSDLGITVRYVDR